MKRSRSLSLFALLLLVFALKASADTQPVPSQDPQASKAMMEERQKFEMQLRDDHVAFNKKMIDERKAFMDSLQGKPDQDKRAALMDFNAKQMADRRTFMKGQYDKRNEFRKQHGMPPLPTPQER